MKKNPKCMDKAVQLIYISTLQCMFETGTLSPGVIIEEITKAMEYLDVFFLYLMASYIRNAVKNNLVDDCWVKEWTECSNRLESCIIKKIKKEDGK
jgi:hypothetical protein